MVKEHVIYINSSNKKQKNIVADAPSIPLCAIDDKNENIIAYCGVLWITQVPDNEKTLFDQKIKAIPEHIIYSEPLANDEIDKWLGERGYKRVVPKDEEIIGEIKINK